MKKIIVIGCPGAGKSTFSKKLCEITKIPLFHLDLLWNKEDKTTVSREEFDYELLKVLKTDEWIVDGNYQRTLEIRLKECDTVFLLDYSTEVCLSGAVDRIGKDRDDLPWIEESLNDDFKKKIIDFSKDKLPEIYDLLLKYKDNKNIVIFKDRNESNIYLEKLI